ncbi:hypothetical protein KIW84_064191 [Lathyrus oleraceus]|uniref:Retrotransposon gag domain-containing protein n=1 Tax=Pisum sativum TaxID=3888 RepID=A0A9D5A8C5_PEA|nr:hypothetical protein KIW84_064191 [Pisum sativum]
MRAIEGDKVFGVVAKEICLVFGLMIPAKFKTPDFDKYKAHSCSKSHLIMYCRKMEAHVEDDKLMMHYFQDNLKGVSSKWYNMDMAPDRRQLLNMSQKDNESFKEYVQRLREVAFQVEPPLTEKELVDWFVDTMQPIFYEIMEPHTIMSRNFP